MFTPAIKDPEWILFPQIADEPQSKVIPLSPAEAMKILLPQSLSVMFNPDLAPDHLGALGLLIKKAKAFRLISGRDLKDDPGRIVELLSEIKNTG